MSTSPKISPASVAFDRSTTKGSDPSLEIHESNSSNNKQQQPPRISSHPSVPVFHSQNPNPNPHKINQSAIKHAPAIQHTFTSPQFTSKTALKPRRILSAVRQDERNYVKKGAQVTIRVKKRVQSVNELVQLEKERNTKEEALKASFNSNLDAAEKKKKLKLVKPPLSLSLVDSKGDLISPEESLQATKDVLNRLKIPYTIKPKGGKKNTAQRSLITPVNDTNNDNNDSSSNYSSKPMSLSAIKESGTGFGKSGFIVAAPEGQTLYSLISSIKVKNRSLNYTKAQNEVIAANNKKPGVLDWPPWLAEFTLSRDVQARNKRVLDNDISRYKKNTEKEGLVNGLVAQKLALMLPKISYKLWTAHVPMPDFKLRPWSVRPLLRAEEDYFRFSAVAWDGHGHGREKKHLMALRGTDVERYMDGTYELLMQFIKGSGDDDSKGKVNVLELGSGSGEHGVHFCLKNSKTIVWQCTDIRQNCIDSVSVRARLAGVLRTDESDADDDGNNSNNSNTVNSQKPLLPPQFFNIMNLNKALELLPSISSTPNTIVVMNVIHVTPYRFIDNIFKLAEAVLQPDGNLYISGPFKVNGVATREHELLDVRVRMMSAKFGVREFEDVVNIGKSNGFELELKFVVEEERLALVFKRMTDDDDDGKEGEGPIKTNILALEGEGVNESKIARGDWEKNEVSSPSRLGLGLGGVGKISSVFGRIKKSLKSKKALAGSGSSVGGGVDEMKGLVFKNDGDVDLDDLLGESVEVEKEVEKEKAGSVSVSKTRRKSIAEKQTEQGNREEKRRSSKAAANSAESKTRRASIERKAEKEKEDKKSGAAERDEIEKANKMADEAIAKFM